MAADLDELVERSRRPCRAPPAAPRRSTVPGIAMSTREAAGVAGARHHLAAEARERLAGAASRQRSNCAGVEHDVAHGGVGERLGDDEDRRSGRMAGTLDEGQPGDDLRRCSAGERPPPGAGSRRPGRAGRCRDRRASRATASITAAALGWLTIRDREAEMEAGGIAHRRVAAGNVRMDRDRAPGHR